VDVTRNSTERRLVLVIGAVVFVDTMFYAAIAPLLPSLVRGLHMSKFSAGVLTASYPIGTLVGSVPGGVLAVRAGPRFTVLVGLALLGCSTLAFGFVNTPAALDAARFIEGVGGACSWAGGLSWIVAEAAPERRGALIGGALGTAIAGELLGPVIGTAANAIGRGAAFSVVVFFAGLLIVQARRLPAPSPRELQGLAEIWAAVRTRVVGAGMWLVTLPAIAAGTLTVLGPLRLHRFGATAAAIGATFLAGAAVEATTTPAIGALSDRHGRMLPLRGALAVTAALLACFTLPRQALTLALLMVATTATLGAFWAPAMAMLSEAADARGLEQGLAAALINLAWAGGQTTGAAAGGAAAKAAGDAVPMLAVAGLCALTLVALRKRAPR
jgi:MFS family permease